MKLIPRAEICILLGIKKNRLSEIIKNHKYLEFPKPIRAGMRPEYYDEAVVIAWDKATDHGSVKWTQTAKLTTLKLDSFDNSLAIKFISKPTTSKPKTFASIIKKHTRKSGKTIVVHLQERNDYERPHSGLNLFRTGDSYRVAHDGSKW